MEATAKLDVDDFEAIWRRRLVDEYLTRKGLSEIRPSYRRQLEMLADGHVSTKDAAAKCGLSFHTVAQARKELYKKLGAAGRDEVIQELLHIALTFLKDRT